jgi:hypothetical protein
MRKALIVGIDYYENIGSLRGCVNDAHDVESAIERHADGTSNFVNPLVMTGTGPDSSLSRAELKRAVRELFEDDAEIALFYFSGHGFLEDTGGYLCTSESIDGDDGLSMSDVMAFANDSRATNKIIILDSCHSGALASGVGGVQQAQLQDGVTILAASTAQQYALEEGGSGVFTSLLVDALNGAAANLVGAITPGSVYAHIDQSLGPWQQRPVFKTNVKTFVSLRQVVAPIPLGELQQLSTIFPTKDYLLPLDPSFEPDRSVQQAEDPDIPPPDPANMATFRILQNYVKVNLVRPVGAPHMYFAAMNSAACKLTVLGEHYWGLVKSGLI